MLGPLYNQTVNPKTDSRPLQHSVLQYYSIPKLKYNPSILKHNKGEKKYELPQKLCKQDISTKTHIQIDRSIFAPIGRMPWIITLHLWELLCIKDAVCRSNKITEGGSVLKGYLSQASGIWKGGDFTSWYIYERIEKYVISVGIRTQKGWQVHFMPVKKWRKCSGFVVYSYFKNSAFTAL